jgi:hypothetical protein
MIRKCITNRSGYERVLEVGREYEILDVQYGIFLGEYYVIADLGNGKTATTHLHRFDITKEEARVLAAISLAKSQEVINEND